MNHWFKQQSIQELVRYNKYLLISTAIISVLALLLGIALINKEERWLLIPAINRAGTTDDCFLKYLS